MTRMIKRINRNAKYNAIYYIVTSLIFVVTTPVLIKYLGPEKYGIWILLQTTVSILAACQFGFGDTTIRLISKYSAVDDKDYIQKTISAIFVFFAAAALCTGFSLYLTAPYLVETVFKIGSDGSHPVLLFQITGIYIVVLFINDFFYAILKGLERYDHVAKLNIIFFLIKNVVFSILAFNGYGLFAIVISMIIVAIIGLTVTVVITATTLPFFKLCFSLNERIVKQILRYSFYTWLQGLGGILFSQSDKFFVGVFAGPQGVAYYSVITQLTSQLNGFLTSIFSYVFPQVSNLSEKGLSTEIAIYYKKVFKSKLFILAFLSLFLLTCSNLIMSWWMGSHFAKEVNFLLKGLVIAYSIQSLSIVPNYFMNGMGNVKINFYFMMMINLTAFIGCMLLIPSQGLTGAVISKLLVALPVACYLVYSSKYMKALLSKTNRF